MDWHAGFMWLRLGTSGDFVNTIMTFGFHTRWKISCLTLIMLMWRIWRAPHNANRWQKGFNSVFKGLNYQLFKNGSAVWRSYLLTGSGHHKQRFYESPRHLCQISLMNSNIHISAFKYTVSQTCQK